MRILKVNWYPPETPELTAFVRGRAELDNVPISASPSPELCRSADAVINCSASHGIPAPIEVFDRCRIVVREGVGYDTVDLEGWGRRGVPVCNVPDYGTTEVADHAMALMLALLRGTATYGPNLQRDPVAGWRFAAAPLVRRLRGATFGIVGLGRIGLATARRAAAFDMRVVFYDPYLPSGTELAVGFERVNHLGDLMAVSDVVSLHTPLNSETRDFIGAGAFAAAKPGLVLINTARGGLVDLDALAEALRSGRIAGAALDVLPKEPADPGHPLIAAWQRGEAWLDGRLLLTPHAAFYSPAAIADMQRKAVEVILAYIEEGRLLNCVNREFLASARAPA